MFDQQQALGPTYIVTREALPVPFIILRGSPVTLASSRHTKKNSGVGLRKSSSVLILPSKMKGILLSTLVISSLLALTEGLSK